MKNPNMKKKATIPKTLNSSNIEDLCEELLKKRPNRRKIADLMKEEGMSFSKDPLLQMGMVLEGLNQVIDPEKKKGPPSDETNSL